MEKGKNVNRLLSLVLVSALTAGSLPLNQVKAVEIDPNTNDVKTEENQKQENVSETVTKEESKTDTEDNTGEKDTSADTINKETEDKNQNDEPISNGSTNQMPKASTPEANGDTRAIKDIQLQDGTVVITKTIKDGGWSAIKAEIEKQLVKNPTVVSAEPIVWEYEVSSLIYALAETGKGTVNTYKTFAELDNGTYTMRVKTGTKWGIVPTYVYADVALTTSYAVDFTSLDSHGTVNVSDKAIESKNVVPNDSLTFTVAPDEGYAVDTVMVGTTIVNANNDGSYTIANVDSDKTVHVTYKEKANTRTITLRKMGTGKVFDATGKELKFTNGIATTKVEKGVGSSVKFVPEGNTYVKSINNIPTEIEDFSADRSYTYAVVASQGNATINVFFDQASLIAKGNKIVSYYDGMNDANISKNVFAVLDVTNSIPSDLDQSKVTLEYLAGKTIFLQDVWRSVTSKIGDWDLTLHNFGKDESERIRIKYAGDAKYPALTLQEDVTLQDQRIDTNLILNENSIVKYNTVENMQEQIYNTVVNGVEDESTILNPKPAITEFEFKFTRVLGVQNITVTYKGNDTYKTATSSIDVTIKKGDANVSVQSQNISYGETFTGPIVKTTPAEADSISVIAGIDGDAQGFASIMLPNSIKEKIDLPLLGDYNPYAMLKKALEHGATIADVKALLNDIKDNLDNIPGLDLTSSIEEIINILNKLPETQGLFIYLNEAPTKAGIYLVGAVTTSAYYNTAIGVGYLTIAPKTQNVSLVFDQNFSNSLNLLPYDERESFDFGGHLLDGSATIDSKYVHTQYAGVSFDGKFHTNTKPILEPGVYTETVYIIGGNYFATPITRVYTIEAQNTEIRFEQKNVSARYDGNGHGLTAGVYAGDKKIADANIMYTGLESDLDVYHSKTQPIDAGLYNVTATYAGDATHKPAINATGTLFIKKSLQVGVVNVGNLTTTYGDLTDLTNVAINTKELADRDATAIKNTIYCKDADDAAGSHKLSVNVPKSVQKNYYHPVVVKDGTHTINPKEVTVSVTGGDENDGTYYKRYGDKDPVYSYAIEGLVNGETDEDFGTVTFEREENEFIGKYDITPITTQTNGNYVVKETKTGTLEILKRPITISAEDITKTYDGKEAISEYTISGLAADMDTSVAEELGISLKMITTQVVNGETVTFEGMPTEAGEYTVTYALDKEKSDMLRDKNNMGDNFDVTFNTFKVTINARPITVSANDVVKTYDGKAAVAEYTIAGLSEDMDASSAEDLGMSFKVITSQIVDGKTVTTEGLPKNAGEYTVTYAMGDKVNANYAVTFNTFKLTINKANVVVTPEFGQNKVVGEKDPTLNYVVSGNVAGEVIDITLTRVAGETVGLYDYVLTVNNSAVNANYNIILGGDSKFEIVAKAVIETPKEEKKDETKPATGDATNVAGAAMMATAAGACLASILRRRRKNSK